MAGVFCHYENVDIPLILYTHAQLQVIFFHLYVHMKVKVILLSLLKLVVEESLLPFSISVIKTYNHPKNIFPIMDMR